jgi:ParB family chromosome partitioning protein
MTTTTVERIEVDPAELLIDVNVRKDERIDKDFLASIQELGILVPITTVRTASGELRVRFGHRRTRAALEVGLPTVPVEIIGDEGEDDASQVERIVGQYAENEHRAGLTAAEKVDVVTQLSAFGVKAADIAKKTRIKRKGCR